MSSSQVSHFLSATNHIIRALRPYRGEEELMSKVTRTVIFSMYMWLREICPEQTPEDTRNVDQLYEQLMEAIHIRFHTYQAGSYFSQPA
jgi:hypothetical protein